MRYIVTGTDNQALNTFCVILLQSTQMTCEKLTVKWVVLK